MKDENGNCIYCGADSKQIVGSEDVGYFACLSCGRREEDKIQGTTQPNDSVNHPTHYTSHPSGVECIQIVEHHNFCTGNAIKYLWRAGLKKDEGLSDKEKQIEDLRKAAWLINREIERLSK